MPDCPEVFCWYKYSTAPYTQQRWGDLPWIMWLLSISHELGVWSVEFQSFWTQYARNCRKSKGRWGSCLQVCHWYWVHTTVPLFASLVNLRTRQDLQTSSSVNGRSNEIISYPQTPRDQTSTFLLYSGFLVILLFLNTSGARYNVVPALVLASSLVKSEHKNYL